MSMPATFQSEFDVQFPVYMVFKGNSPLCYEDGFFVFQSEGVAEEMAKGMRDGLFQQYERWEPLPGFWHVRTMTLEQIREGVSHYRQSQTRLKNIKYVAIPKDGQKVLVDTDEGTGFLSSLTAEMSFDVFLEKSIKHVGQPLETGKRRVGDKPS
jgi:hypothetical protein